MIKTLLTAALVCFLSTAGALAKQPNVIFMLADDLGYGDLSSYNPNSEGEAPNNTPIRTPNLDHLANSGVRYTDFHSAAPICSPSRRALLTARYPNRLGEWAEAYAGGKDPQFFVLDEVAGYLLTIWWFEGPSLLALFTAFCAFRFFDIVKPPPVRNVERVGGGAGIVLDDLVAGVYGLVVVMVPARLLIDAPWGAAS